MMTFANLRLGNKVRYRWKATIRGFPTHHHDESEIKTAESYDLTILIISYSNLSLYTEVGRQRGEMESI